MIVSQVSHTTTYKGWSHSQHALIKSQGTLWIGHQPITGCTVYIYKTYMYLFIQIDRQHIQFRVSSPPWLWFVGGNQGSLRKPHWHRKNIQTPQSTAGSIIDLVAARQQCESPSHHTTTFRSHGEQKTLGWRVLKKMNSLLVASAASYSYWWVLWTGIKKNICTRTISGLWATSDLWSFSHLCDCDGTIQVKKKKTWNSLETFSVWDLHLKQVVWRLMISAHKKLDFFTLSHLTLKYSVSKHH